MNARTAYSDEVTLNLVYVGESANGKSIHFRVPEGGDVWLPKSLIEIEDNPTRGLNVDILCKRWLAEKEGLI